MSRARRRQAQRQLPTLVEGVVGSDEPQAADLDAHPPGPGRTNVDADAEAPVSLPPPEHPGRHLRRRRSATSLPPLPVPTDIPEDAPGRVEFITIDVTALDLPPPRRQQTLLDQPQPQPTLESRHRLNLRGEVVQLAVLAVAILIAFAIGMRVTG
jgi:hypothetical protein